ncbi:MAG: hypothetical protein LWX83_14720 [Anaerolineae bacterium]|nr:hypothetical protein [Anaerolineae bacterium]
MKQTHYQKIRRIVGEVLSQLLNVPLMAGLLLTFMLSRLSPTEPNLYSGYLWSMLFLCLIPLSSLLFYIPFGHKSQEQINHRQRIASFALMIISYPLGVLVLFLTGAPLIFRSMAVVYSLVTVGLIVFNLFIHYKASGHAAGVAGPVASLVYFFGWWAAPLLLLLPLVTWARVAAKGHSAWQTVVGAGMSLAITVSVLYAYGFSPFSGLFQ